MFAKLRRAWARRRDPERMQEDAESRLRAEQEIRQAEQAKSDDRRALEGIQKSFPHR